MPDFNINDGRTAALAPDDLALLEAHGAVMQKFKAWCQSLTCNTFEETDFTDLAMGFFIALGVVGDGGPTIAEPYYDAHRLGSLARYTYKYWS